MIRDTVNLENGDKWKIRIANGTNSVLRKDERLLCKEEDVTEDEEDREDAYGIRLHSGYAQRWTDNEIIEALIYAYERGRSEGGK